MGCIVYVQYMLQNTQTSQLTPNFEFIPCVSSPWLRSISKILYFNPHIKKIMINYTDEKMNWLDFTLQLRYMRVYAFLPFYATRNYIRVFLRAHGWQSFLSNFFDQWTCPPYHLEGFGVSVLNYVQRKAMIENKCNTIPHPTFKTQREWSTHTRWWAFTKDTHSKSNEQVFPKQELIQLH